MLAIEGIPLYYMELCIGQRMRKGSIGVWNEISPYLGGVGLASVVVCFLVSLYYNVIIAWCVFYFFKSFQNPLPWSSCPLEEVTVENATIMASALECEETSATTYFWYRTTLGISSSIEDSGGMNWKLCGCLVGTWTLVWLCMMKGIKMTGKVRHEITHTSIEHLPAYSLACGEVGGRYSLNKRLMGMRRWIGSHFHNWTCLSDYDGVAFSIELLE